MSTLSNIHFFLGSAGSGIRRPFAKYLTQVISTPETTVINGLKLLHPFFYFFLSKSTIGNSINSLAVTFGHGSNIFRCSATAFYLKNLNTGINNIIEESYSTQIL